MKTEKIIQNIGSIHFYMIDLKILLIIVLLIILIIVIHVNIKHFQNISPDLSEQWEFQEFGAENIYLIRSVSEDAYWSDKSSTKSNIIPAGEPIIILSPKQDTRVRAIREPGGEEKYKLTLVPTSNPVINDDIYVVKGKEGEPIKIELFGHPGIFLIKDLGYRITAVKDGATSFERYLFIPADEGTIKCFRDEDRFWTVHDDPLDIEVHHDHKNDGKIMKGWAFKPVSSFGGRVLLNKNVNEAMSFEKIQLNDKEFNLRTMTDPKLYLTVFADTLFMFPKTPEEAKNDVMCRFTRRDINEKPPLLPGKQPEFNDPMRVFRSIIDKRPIIISDKKLVLAKSAEIPGTKFKISNDRYLSSVNPKGFVLLNDNDEVILDDKYVSTFVLESFPSGGILIRLAINPSYFLTIKDDVVSIGNDSSLVEKSLFLVEFPSETKKISPSFNENLDIAINQGKIMMKYNR